MDWTKKLDENRLDENWAHACKHTGACGYPCVPPPHSLPASTGSGNSVNAGQSEKLQVKRGGI